MSEFIVTGPDGKKYRVQGDSAEGAAEAVSAMVGEVSPPDRMAAGEAIAARNRAGYEAAGVDLSGQGEARAEADAAAEQGIARSGMSRGTAMMLKGAQGGTMGFADELIGAVSPAAGEAARAGQRQADAAYPGLSMATEIGAAIASPLARALGPVKTVGQAARTGAVIGAAEATGNAEGGPLARLDDAAMGGTVGFFAAGAGDVLFRGATSGFRRLAERSETRPTIELLRATKNELYGKVRAAGIGFDVNDLTAMNNRIVRLSQTARWDVDPNLAVDDGAVAALKRVGNRLQAAQRTGKPISLNNLDKMRQNLFDIYNRTDHPFVLAVISEVDDLISSKAQGNELLQAARAANKRYAQAQLLHNAFEKAERQTAATGSGGNILNKYRQAVNRIIDKPSEAKFFSEEQLALMRQFVMGDGVENTLRRAGKLAPGGNGLMTALNVYAASIDPTMLVVTGAAQAAKTGADRSAMRGSEGLLDAVSTGVIKPPQPRPDLRVPAAGIGSGSGQLFE